MAIDTDTLDWLLDSDPALRWQVQRDLADAPTEVWQATRDRVATEGFGAALLARQDPDGQWDGGAFFPAGWADDEAAQQTGQPWTTTTWSLKSLREWGVPAERLAGTVDKLAAHSRWEYEDMPYWGGEVDVCINAWTLGTGAWLGADVRRLVDWFPRTRLADGGWNCVATEDGSSDRSSFHSTLNALTGMLAYEQFTGDTILREPRQQATEYLLERHLMHRASTGELVGSFVTRFVHPRQWRYSALAALDHLREAAEHDRPGDTHRDPRLAEAVAAVREQRQPDGRWLQGGRSPGRVWFEIDVEAGERSRWVTFTALRALRWWDSGTWDAGTLD